MAYWLLKSEPGTWSWADQVARGTEPWDGVRNAQAQANLRAMAVGDLAFFYHSVSEKRIRGVVEIVGAFRPDPTDATGRHGLVDVKALYPLPTPVSLATIKADPRLAHLALVRQARLSVQPVDAEAWALILSLGGA
ncbi:EVE domain-containing protein [Pararhodospirillum oryzae]|uniref:Ubiquinol-cytochrome c reductase n=1 Tax=Pararhodospirillum oryzae TaxID=478448 RepID=A0A512HAN9_9PROT|nr:EVE domain-containing protein [Pararhodospirillum oryzae]GEO82521.1 ubiquinol-cytochrome c reductase [Pararhodospirillum oryzae]